MEGNIDSGVKDSSRPPLIKQTPRDEVITLIYKVKEEEKKRRSSEKTRKLEGLKHDFESTFYHLCLDYFGLGDEQLRVLNYAALEELEKLVARRALSRSLPYRCLAYTPIVGWMWYGLNACVKADERGYDCYRDPKPGKSWSYRHLRGKLKKAHGKNWFQEIIRRERTERTMKSSYGK